MNLFEKLAKNQAIPPFLNKKGTFVVDEDIGISLLTAASSNVKDNKFLLVTSNLYKAQKLYGLLKIFLPKKRIYLFPNDELLRAETIAQSKEMSAHRIFVLDEILNGNVDIIVTNLAAALRFLPDPITYQSKVLNFKVGEKYNFNDLKILLAKNGYKSVNKIDQSLQFAVRGDLIDIFSVNNDFPIRIEFFDDEIESIRFFDLAKQTSINKVDEVKVLPASDILLNSEELIQVDKRLNELLKNDIKRLSNEKSSLLHQNIQEVIEDIKDGQTKEKHYKYYSKLLTCRNTIFDYCSDFINVLVNEESLLNSNQILMDESFNFLSEIFSEGKCLSNLETYMDLKPILRSLKSNCITTNTFFKASSSVNFKAKHVPFVSNKTSDALNIIKTYINENYQIVIALSNKEHSLITTEMLSKDDIRYEVVNDFELPKNGFIGISYINLPNGFILEDEKIVYLTGYELFNEKIRSARFDNRFKEGTILTSFEDLEPGDYVVHEYQGIGQYLGLETLLVDNVHKDYLKISYFGDEKLYVPLDQFQLVRKYLGKEGRAPRLTHLHTKDWENTKKRVKERINELANRLMTLYTERSKVKGFAFQKDDELQDEFEKAFNHELTMDQDKAVKEIKQDMEKESPMDRLLCGDVGFGKTEVAFRAAFKAIISFKQVAMLCPTTLLARQHYELALKRFAGFDINIAIFSRLIPEKTQKKYLKEIEEGKIHLIIGTHRLLSKDMVFKDLGLLIVDEEQRFGVEQKERLKELKNNIDVLTLSATPIPRTLQISLLGVRSLSKIDTAPLERMPIQTYVTPFNLMVVKELIEREIGRNGQVFFLHNNISTLYNRAKKLQDILPSIKIGVAHGKMFREEIEDVMLKFYKGDLDVLVCTSIVENGIDVPNANMIIIEDSENYGLSQLYQIKGRVGRSDRIAYAYLMYTDGKILNEKAQKRLQTLQEFTELGSGYKIAQRDLMIRGAGDILGAEQAGYIDSIGLDMYIKLLNEAVKEKMGEGSHSVDKANGYNFNLSLDAYIPESFANSSDKIQLYQEILSVNDLETLGDIKLKTIDIYGKLPKEVESLFIKREINLLIKKANLTKAEEFSQYFEIQLGKEFVNIRGVGNLLFETLIPYLSVIKVSYASNIFKIRINKRKSYVNDMVDILRRLINIIEKNKTKEIV